MKNKALGKHKTAINFYLRLNYHHTVSICIKGKLQNKPEMFNFTCTEKPRYCITQRKMRKVAPILLEKVKIVSEVSQIEDLNSYMSNHINHNSIQFQ